MTHPSHQFTHNILIAARFVLHSAFTTISVDREYIWGNIFLLTLRRKGEEIEKTEMLSGKKFLITYHGIDIA